MENAIATMPVGNMNIVRLNRQLNFRAKKVLKLINDCIKNKRILDAMVLQDWFMEEIIKPRKRVINGDYLGYRNEQGYPVYEKILEYDLRKKQIEKNGGYMNCWHLTEARQILKYYIGSLVLSNHLTVFPTIEIDSIPEDSKEITNE